MNEMVTTRLTPVEAYANEVFGDNGRQSELWASLPRHMAPDRFRRNCIILLMQKPELLKFDPRFIYREVAKAAALGLLLDPQLGEAYVVPVYVPGRQGKAAHYEPQLRVGYRGLIKLARQSGEVRRIYAHEVCEHDHIECDMGVDKRLVHKPQLFADRGAIIGYYAVIHYADGETDFEPMSLADIHAIRDQKSDGWRAYQAGRIKSTPWATDFAEMAKKTVIRRLLKRVPQSPELSDALALEGAADETERRVLSAPAPQSPKRGRPPKRSIKSDLDNFAETDSSAESPAGAEDAGMAAASRERVTSRHEERDASTPAPDESGGVADDDGAGTITDSDETAALEMARRDGRHAFEHRNPRAVPSSLKTKKRREEAEAWLNGYDEAAFDEASRHATDFDEASEPEKDEAEA